MNLERKEEYWNTLLHGVAAIASFVGIFILLWINRDGKEMMGQIALIVYGLSLVALYGCSTLLHFSSYRGLPERIQHVFGVMDHSAIYILIAGSYTPFLYFALDGTQRLIWLCIIWLLAGFGVVYQSFFLNKYKHISTSIYILMGWLVLFIYGPIKDFLSFNSLLLLIIGGILFTVGTIFFSMKKVYMHTIWHLFVMGGTATMYSAIVLVIL
ncbi:hemolysin III family HylIII inner membrane protein [Erysipelotrichaceae bacterium]|nr:hemolysin III family HylIII inner membrane protein [Erysipelotrichaceae bacterium]